MIIFNSLSYEQQQAIEKTKHYVASKLIYDTSGHDLAHIRRVVNLAGQILVKESDVNVFIVIMAAYLHDIIDDKIVADVTQAKASLMLFLAVLNLSDIEKDHIFEVIDNMSYRKNLSHQMTLSKEGQIVQDADRLDALGAIGIGRAFYYGGHKKEMMYDATILPREHLTNENYRYSGTVINHFYEKLLRLTELMNTAEGKRIASKRHQIVLQFVQQFEQEWCGNYD